MAVCRDGWLVERGLAVCRDAWVVVERARGSAVTRGWWSGLGGLP